MVRIVVSIAVVEPIGNKKEVQGGDPMLYYPADKVKKKIAVPTVHDMQSETTGNDSDDETILIPLRKDQPERVSRGEPVCRDGLASELERIASAIAATHESEAKDLRTFTAVLRDSAVNILQSLVSDPDARDET